MPTLRIHKDNQKALHFFTITTIEWIDIFTKLEYFSLIIDSLKFCQQKKNLLLFEYVIMTNHLHLIAKTSSIVGLSQIISDFKKYTTQEIYKLLEKDNRKYILSLLKNSYSKKFGYKNQIWQRENYPEPIESEEFLNSKVNYIYYNPVRKGYVGKPEDWLFSSARNRILNDETLIKVEKYF